MKKAMLALTLSCMLLSCTQDKKQSVPSTLFQCISSQSLCQVPTDFGVISIKFNVEKVLTELPFTVQVELPASEEARKELIAETPIVVQGYMEGKTMFMGKIPLFFTKKLSNADAHHFMAESMLGSCSEDIMTWRLWLTLEQHGKGDDKKQATFFIDFDSTRF